MIEVLSLGAGVQSSAVLLMSIRGELPRLDHVIFSDTGWEPQAVYDWLAVLEREMVAAGVTFARVQQGNLRDDALVSQVRGVATDGNRWASLPYFTQGESGAGMIRRQCTYEYKIRPIEMYCRRQVLGLEPNKWAPREPKIRQWFGISHDERQRMRTSSEKWKVNWYPLVESRTTRHMCLEWLRGNGFPEPPRSACIGCPYHSDAEWRNLKLNSPAVFEDACEFDEAIRNCGGMRGQVFLHSSRRPLREVDFRNDFDKGQLPLFQDECEGMCGV